jgi:hypothetical protein
MKKLFATFAILVAIFMVSGTALAGNVADANATAGAMVASDPSATVNQNFEASDIPQGFANGTEMTFPGVSPYFGPDRHPGPNSIDLRMILDVKSTWKRFELAPTATQAKMDIRARHLVPTMKKLGIKPSPDDTIDIFIGTPPPSAKLLGVVMVRVRDTEATTFEAMAEAGLRGLDGMGDAIFIVAFGSQKVVKGSGWGIGFHHTTATVSDGKDLGTVTSGGTGYSTSEAGYKDKPWVHALIVTMP